MVQKQISKKEPAFAAGSERELKYFKEMFLL